MKVLRDDHREMWVPPMFVATGKTLKVRGTNITTTIASNHQVRSNQSLA